MAINGLKKYLLVRRPHSMVLLTTHSEASCAAGVRRNIWRAVLVSAEVTRMEKDSTSLKLRRTG